MTVSVLERAPDFDMVGTADSTRYRERESVCVCVCVCVCVVQTMAGGAEQKEQLPFQH